MLDNAEFWGLIGDISLRPLTPAEEAALQAYAEGHVGWYRDVTDSEMSRLKDLGLVTFSWNRMGAVCYEGTKATDLLLAIRHAGRLPELLASWRLLCA